MRLRWVSAWPGRLPTSLAGAVLVVALAAVLPASSAPAATAPGQVTVGPEPVLLGQPADPFLGKLTPTDDADELGMFSSQITWPLVAMHAALLPNGRVITYGAPIGVPAQGGLDFAQWRPALGAGPGAHDHVPAMHQYDSFCNALELLPDGRVLMVGGNSTTATHIIDPQTGEQSMGDTLAYDRWYATVLRLPDDRMLVLGGADYYHTHAYLNPGDNTGVATIPEIGDGTGEWSALPGAQSSRAFGARDNRWWYPRAFVDPDGLVFGVSFDRMWRLDPDGEGSIEALGVLPEPIGISGSSVMYEPGKILFSGGGQRFNETSEVATDAATVVDINASQPVVTSVDAMHHSRHWHNLTALPNGEVLANGGTAVGTLPGAANSRYQAEIWRPATGEWREAATAVRTRTYHSVSLLLPAGTVLTAGGGLPGPEDNLNGEIYYPPYLFTRDGDDQVAWADRPELRSIAGTVAYGQELHLGLGDDRPIAEASLIKLGSVTHSYTTDQRRVPVPVNQAGSELTVTLPSSPHVLPPGSYLLQAVDADGVPTPSQIITIHQDGSPGTVTIHEPDQAPIGEPGGSSEPGIVPLTPDTFVGLEPFTSYGLRVRHDNPVARLAAVGSGSSALLQAEASFVVREGLADPECVSFESPNHPGAYLRHQGFQVFLHSDNGSALFAADATFCPTAGLAGQYLSLASYNYPDRYLRHRGGQVYIDVFNNTEQLRREATFAIRPGWQPPPDAGPSGMEVR